VLRVSISANACPEPPAVRPPALQPPLEPRCWPCRPGWLNHINDATPPHPAGTPGLFKPAKKPGCSVADAGQLPWRPGTMPSRVRSTWASRAAARRHRADPGGALLMPAALSCPASRKESNHGRPGPEYKGCDCRARRRLLPQRRGGAVGGRSGQPPAGHSYLPNERRASRGRRPCPRSSPPPSDWIGDLGGAITGDPRQILDRAPGGTEFTIPDCSDPRAIISYALQRLNVIIAAYQDFLDQVRGRDDVSFALVVGLLAAKAHRRAHIEAALAGQPGAA